jgi:hypothetical protein
VSLPLALSLCQTNPVTGACVNPATSSSSVTVQMDPHPLRLRRVQRLCHRASDLSESRVCSAPRVLHRELRRAILDTSASLRDEMSELFGGPPGGATPRNEITLWTGERVTITLQRFGPVSICGSAAIGLTAEFERRSRRVGDRS